MVDKCKDCAHLSPRDVFCGVCVLKGEKQSVDAEACGSFKPVSKCKYCSKYQPNEDGECLGTCAGTMVFPDLTGCEDFVATKA